jgi:hypothetical protein
VCESSAGGEEAVCRTSRVIRSCILTQLYGATYIFPDEQHRVYDFAVDGVAGWGCHIEPEFGAPHLVLVFYPPTGWFQDAKFPETIDCCTSLVVGAVWMMLDGCFQGLMDGSRSY